jgi:hypothetical protein
MEVTMNKTMKAETITNARFLDSLAEIIARNFTTDALAPTRSKAAREELIEHLEGVTGASPSWSFWGDVATRKAWNC